MGKSVFALPARVDVFTETGIGPCEKEESVMERFTILLRSVQEASKFVDKVSAYAETVYLITGPYQIDAKSFLGVVGIGTGKKVTVEVPAESGAGIRRELAPFTV